LDHEKKKRIDQKIFTRGGIWRGGGDQTGNTRWREGGGGMKGKR